MKNYIARGETLLITAGADIASGAVVIAGDAIGIAGGAIANGADGHINLTGVYDLPKVGSEAWTVGQLVFWDAGNGYCTVTGAGGLVPLGVAAQAVDNKAGSIIGQVRLNGSAAPIAAHVADASTGSGAEINALRDALIVAGLMASS